MTCFRLTLEIIPHFVSEPTFAMGLNCKAGEKISQCWGTSFAITSASKCCQQAGGTELTRLCWAPVPVCVPVMFVHVTLDGLTNLEGKARLVLESEFAKLSVEKLRRHPVLTCVDCLCTNI